MAPGAAMGAGVGALAAPAPPAGALPQVVMGKTLRMSGDSASLGRREVQSSADASKAAAPQLQAQVMTNSPHWSPNAPLRAPIVGQHQHYARSGPAVTEPQHELSSAEREQATRKLERKLRELLDAKISSGDTKYGAVALRNGAAFVRIS